MLNISININQEIFMSKAAAIPETTTDRQYNINLYNIELLINALESISYIELVLRKPQLTNFEELFVKLNYQMLGSCLQKLNREFTAENRQLAEAVFIDIVGRKERQCRFDRMDVAHAPDLLTLIAPNNSILLMKEQLLSDCYKFKQQATRTIEKYYQLYDLQENWQECIESNSSKIIGQLNSGNLPDFTIDTALFSRQHISNFLSNIRQTLAITGEIVSGASIFNQTISLVAAQIIGNNIKELRANGTIFNVSQTIINNRNKIAHSNSLSELTETRNFIYNEYIIPCYQALKEELEKLPQLPLAELAAVNPAQDNKEQEEIVTVPAKTIDYVGNQLELVKKLKKYNINIPQKLINEAKRTNQRIFNDFELTNLVMYGITNDCIDDEFVKIIQSINLYTDTKSNILFNTSMSFEKDSNFASDVAKPGKKLYRYTSMIMPNEQRIHLPCEEFHFIRIGITAPQTIEMTLFGAALRRSGYKPSNIVEVFLDQGVNVNVTELTNAGEMQPILNSLLYLNDDLNWIASFLSQSNPNSYDERGAPVLLFASTLLGLDKIKLLLDFGANPTSIIRYNATDIKSRMIGNILSQVIYESRIEQEKTIDLIKIFVSEVAYQQGASKALKMIDNNFHYEIDDLKIHNKTRVTVINVSEQEMRAREKLGITNQNEWQRYLEPSESENSKTIKVIKRVKKTNSEIAIRFNKPEAARILKILETLAVSDFPTKDIFSAILSDDIGRIQPEISQKYNNNERLIELFTAKLGYFNLKGEKEEIDIISFAKLFCSKDVQRELLKIKLRLPLQKPAEAIKPLEQSFTEMVTRQNDKKPGSGASL
jgi:hypothetical protein